MNTYAVAIAVDNCSYNFHVPSKDAVYDLIASVSGSIQRLAVWEETHVGTDTSFREMSREEIVAICEGFDYLEVKEAVKS
jgi:hypothetical protein